MGYLIKVDTREKLGWWFPPDFYFDGSVKATLKTGDYTVEGYEDIITIDRKRSVSELAGNLVAPRFAREMKRMESFKIAVVLMEFYPEDLDLWPTQLSPKQQKLVRTTPKFLRRCIHKFEEDHGVQFIFGGYEAKEICYNLLKNVCLGETHE